MKKPLSLTAALVWLALPVLANAETLTLKSTAQSDAKTYVFCLTGDSRATAKSLLQRIKDSSGIKTGNARQITRKWMSEGYCQQMLAGFDARIPSLRQTSRTVLSDAGFDPARPVTAQLQRDPGKRDGMITAFQTLSNVIKIKAEPSTPEANTSCVQTAGTGTGGPLVICD